MEGKRYGLFGTDGNKVRFRQIVCGLRLEEKISAVPNPVLDTGKGLGRPLNAILFAPDLA